MSACYIPDWSERGYPDINDPDETQDQEDSAGDADYHAKKDDELTEGVIDNVKE